MGNETQQARPTPGGGDYESSQPPVPSSSQRTLEEVRIVRSIERGPVESRSCTDIFCSICFGLLMILAVGATVFVLQNGKNATTQTPSEFFLQAPHPFSVAHGASFVQARGVYHGVNLNKRHSLDGVLDDASQHDFLERVDDAPDDGNEKAQSEEQTPVEKENEIVMSDLQTTSWLTVSVALAAVIISIAFVITVPACAEAVVWATIYGLIAIIGSAGVYFLVQCFLPENAAVSQTYLIGALLLFLIAGVFALVIYCMRERLERSVQIVAAATQFTKDVLSVIVIPVLVFGVFMSVLLLWIYLFGVLIESKPKDPKEDKTGGVIALLVFTLWWTAEVALAFAELATSATCSQWYFSHHRENSDKKYTFVRTALKWSAFYHFGSVCFGALILTIVSILRFIANQAQQQAQREGNIASGCLACCCSAFLACVESIVRYLNRVAYIMIGLTGQPFCDSAQIGALQIIENPYAATFVEGLGLLFALIGSFFVASVTTLMAALALYMVPAFDTVQLQGFILFLYFVLAFIISAIFFSVYNISADTILFCITTDTVLHNGVPLVLPDKLSMIKPRYQRLGSDNIPPPPPSAEAQ